MTPIIDIGEILISGPRNDYLLRPSFLSMSLLARHHNVVDTYANIHGGKLAKETERYKNSFGKIPDFCHKEINKITAGILSDAMDIMQCCCEQDITEIIGYFEFTEYGFIYRNGSMDEEKIITFAQNLMTHGIIGKAKIRRLQRNEIKTFSSGFNAVEYINIARAHLGISRSEAEKLTMTEFQYLLSAKFPEEKGFTREEYDSVVDEYFKKREQRIKNARQQK